MSLFETSFDEQIAIVGLIAVCLKMSFDRRQNLVNGNMTFKSLDTFLKLCGLIVMIFSFILILNHYKWYGAVLMYIINFFIATIVVVIINRFLSNKVIFICSSILLVIMVVFQSILIFNN